MCNKPDIRFKWTCPHCGFENLSFATAKDSYGTCEPLFAYCDHDSGGCDRMVAIKPRLHVQAEVFALVGTEKEHFPHLDAQLDEMERQAEAVL